MVFDKAYVDFKHLKTLDVRGIFWVTCAKDNMRYEVVEQHVGGKWMLVVGPALQRRTQTWRLLLQAKLWDSRWLASGNTCGRSASSSRMRGYGWLA